MNYSDTVLLTLLIEEVLAGAEGTIQSITAAEGVAFACCFHCVQAMGSGVLLLECGRRMQGCAREQ